MSEVAGKQDSRVPPAWWRLSLILAAGVALGLTPFLLYLSPELEPRGVRASYLTLALFVYAGIVVRWKARGFVSNATERPNLWEWLLAGWDAVGVSAAGSLVGFMWYGLSYLLWWAVVAGAQLLSFTLATLPATVAMYGSALFFGVFAMAMPFVLSDTTPAKLYPGVAGIRSAFFPLTARPWKLVVVALAGLAGAVAALTILDLDVYGLWFTLGLTIFFILTGQPLRELGAGKRPSARTAKLLAAVSELLAAAGYQLTEKPMTGDPEVDPLISSLDILALAGDRGYAIRAMTLESSKAEIEWSTVFEVRTAAKALQRALHDSGAKQIALEPFLVVAGMPIGDALREACLGAGVKLAHLPDVDELTKPTPTVAELREAAVRVLEAPLAEAPGGEQDSKAGPAQ